MRKLRAFTLLELIVVIVILAILAALAVPTFMRVIDKSKDSTALASMGAVARDAQALQAFTPEGPWSEESIVKAVEETPTNAAYSLGMHAAAGTMTASAEAGRPVAGEVRYHIAQTVVGLAVLSDSGNICAVALDKASILASGCVDLDLAGSDPAKAIAEDPAAWGQEGSEEEPTEEPTEEPVVVVAPPTNFSATVMGEVVNLSWEAPTTAFTAYELTLNGEEITPPSVEQTSLELPRPEVTVATYVLSAVAGNVTSPAVSAPATFSPNTPVGLAATGAANARTLAWTPSEGATSYNVFKNGVSVAILEGDVTSYGISVLNGELSTYEVSAGNITGWSGKASVVVKQAAAAPTDLKVSFNGSGATFATLSWTPTGDTTLTGYATKAGAQSGSATSNQSSSNLTVTAGQTVTFSVQALAPGGNSELVTVLVEVPSMLTFKKVDSVSTATAERGMGEIMALNSTGTMLAVGAPSEGAVYVYTKSGTNWVSETKISAPGDAYSFGKSVAFDGTTIVVGAPFENNNTGAAYVFTSSGTAWTQQQRLTGVSQGGFFGTSVSISGESIAVGIPGFVKAQVFTRSAGVWTSQSEIPTYTGGTSFGQVVALNGNTLVVGAPSHLNSASVSSGAAYVYTRTGSAWAYGATLAPATGVSNGKFGSALSVVSGHIVVGAPSENAAYAYALELNAWVLKARMTGSGSATGDGFGTSVSRNTIGTIVIGAPGQDVAGRADAGAVYRFTQSGATYVQNLRLVQPGATADNKFGNSVAIANTNTNFQVGVPGEDGAASNTGSFYSF